MISVSILSAFERDAYLNGRYTTEREKSDIVPITANEIRTFFEGFKRDKWLKIDFSGKADEIPTYLSMLANKEECQV